MLDATLSWFGRIWIATGVLGMLVYYFGLPSSLTNDWALFHLGWVPIGAVPNPVNILWWIAMVIIVSPGLGALFLRDRLRERKNADRLLRAGEGENLGG